MSHNITHIYFVPGLAANKEIFKNIRLSDEIFKMHYLEWLLPEEKESLTSYAKRMANCVEHENIVLIGVSFGGVVAQEMSLFLNLKKLIIISSVKTKHELPLRLVLARKTLAYKLIPTRLVLSATDLTKFAIGPKTKKRLQIYQEYLSVRDAHYLDWAIENMVCWDREIAVAGITHIHGDKDMVFPIEKIKECIVVKGGTHIMILNKFNWFNKNLPTLILGENGGR
ncbi:MAG: alpha/beta hydrolase [Flavobacteriaceae bacterium CG_4_8_14_3_um_filter_34_10]|nr:MAG: alpha/beta hydrolase [Flavobacteriaceae bacterium CG2_30_34_30]PIQ17249.1 MAG: alpha/beta hydrolase [Flavobacteriaceae bacterium CG18_big_fil_WC_8_21_14_2_50_34_36]PIV48599.1 MAG: alpha/beta hydrolase [Flavobacteriaceae bacterium CG02_land_8_20_14_3_00_34_13]PIX10099.1 MAG: alpha/beta hydrolase [Flavobacteriaceae bacterium CG_4_8_14_3_um_filter_34_10]PIZ07043.1 MAG: alpha/beta hydrolase [Flavobacteriaceae bacterium CG_4_10_14_0_8_um_filter_34_31]PJC07326.1 MAG: alpha/beta hydrolase [Fl